VPKQFWKQKNTAGGNQQEKHKGRRRAYGDAGPAAFSPHGCASVNLLQDVDAEFTKTGAAHRAFQRAETPRGLPFIRRNDIIMIPDMQYGGKDDEVKLFDAWLPALELAGDHIRSGGSWLSGH
jgi:hypothetical protein